MKITKRQLRKILLREMSLAGNQGEYQQEYDLVANNIRVDSRPPSSVSFFLRSLESSYENRFYNHGGGPNIGIHLSLINRLMLNGNRPNPGYEGTPLGGDIRSHIEKIKQKLTLDRGFLTPAGNGRLDALLDHLSQVC